jgi:hypothetical protein
MTDIKLEMMKHWILVHLGDVQKNIYDVFLHAIITCANSCSVRT